jgi:phosphoribosylglycinamide formyltransferase-1
MKRIVALISGRGSNLEAILADLRGPGATPAGRVVAVLSNEPEAGGLQLAQRAGIPAVAVAHREHRTRDAFEARLAAAVDEHAPDLVVLAGFMRILGSGFVARYAGRLLNIHPSLLPAYPGLATHRRALADGVAIHGCTVHFVTPALDHGPIVIQGAVGVRAADDEETLAARVLRIEHLIYPRAVRWFCEGRLTLVDGRARLSGERDGDRLVFAGH